MEEMDEGTPAQIVAIADDLTGALEIGAKFADYGLPATVVTDLPQAMASASPVLVVDTESRHLSALEAGERTRVAAQFAGPGARLVYKKTDSTLRGNIGAELRAVTNVFGERRIIYAPAYPDMGRTVHGGKLFVHGTPVHETDFARDRWSPVRDCRVHSVLEDLPVLVLDGGCNADIEAAACLILAEPVPQLCAGPAALAGELARQLGSAAKIVVPHGSVARCLVVNGSLHPVSIEQIECAQANALFDHHWRCFEEQVEGVASERALQVGKRIRSMLADAPVDALVVFGGDTAFGIHRAFGAPAFEAIGEIAPGVAMARSAGLLWITKAGGFGPPDILATIRKRLT